MWRSGSGGLGSVPGSGGLGSVPGSGGLRSVPGSGGLGSVPGSGSLSVHAGQLSAYSEINISGKHRGFDGVLFNRATTKRHTSLG